MPDDTLKTLADLPRIPWNAEYAQDPIPQLVNGYLEHGPVFGLQDSPSRGADNPGMVFLIGPEANRLVYQNIDTFWWGPVYAGLERAWGRTLITMDGEENRWWRKLIQPMVGGKSLPDHLVLMKRVIASHVDRWGDEGTIDVFESLRRLIFEIAARVFAGLDDPDELEEFEQIYDRLGRDTDNPFAGARFDYDPEIVEELKVRIRPMVRERRGLVTDDVSNLLDQLATATGEDGRPLEEADIVSHVFLMLLAGHETSTILGSWVLWELGAKPGPYERVKAEIDGIEEDTGVRLLRQSPYINQVLMEAERLYPPLPITGRALQDDVEFSGFRLPSGLIVQMSAGATHRLPTVFEDPDSFDPDRFGPDREEHMRERMTLTGFGAGPRVCLGMPFAKVEIAEILVQVLRSYDIESHKKQPLSLRRGATTMPGEPVMLELTPR